MGSPGSGAADGGIGPIVWVRRRNGSWWPGKIMEPEELAECNLTSPRTGTPVKLLGREDASVDWYNLEKSKRVKAFRCGEFDDCIVRAESSQGMPIKKREKYARREDAILHALELEKKLLRKQGKLAAASNCQSSKSPGSAKKEPGTYSDGLAKNSGKYGNVKLDQLYRSVDTDNIMDSIPSSLMIPVKAQDGIQPIREEDHSEATPRMRGLQDLGLRTAPLKRKLLSSVGFDGSVKPMADSHSEVPPSMERTTQENGFEQMGAIWRAKRSRCLYLPADLSDSIDGKELSLSQIKMSPTQFEDDNDFHPYIGSLNEENSSSGFMEDVEYDSADSNSSESESDTSETEPDMDKQMTIISDANVPTEAEQNALGHPGALDMGSTSSEESFGSAFSGDICHLYPDDPLLGNEAVSKWQLKGKRNIRHLTRRSFDTDYGKGSNGLSHRTYHGMIGTTLGRRSYGVNDNNVDKIYTKSNVDGLDDGGYSYMSKFASKGRNSTSYYVTDWEGMDWEDQRVFRGRWEDRLEHFNPVFAGSHYFGGRARSMLVDVDLKVQASYQKERVPIVSLMSKLNGKAIIGHPIKIETLQDGSSKTLIPTNEYNSNEAVDHDGNTALQPAWRTARRSNLRVPRPYFASPLGDDVAEDVLYVDQERSQPFKKSTVRSFSHKASLVRKSFLHVPQPPMDRKFPRKLLKKASSPSYQKTRTLASIAIQPNFGPKPTCDTSKSQMDGIKPETSGPTTVACIPVKLVFSRLLEKINRPPSKATRKVVLSNRVKDRQTS